LSYTFKRKQRLLQASQFSLVFNQTNYKAANAVLLLLVRENNQQFARLGLIVAKKNIKLAVERNRVKRQIREFFRLHQEQLQGLDLIFLVRKGLGELSNQQIRQNLASLVIKIIISRQKLQSQS